MMLLYPFTYRNKEVERLIQLLLLGKWLRELKCIRSIRHLAVWRKVFMQWLHLKWLKRANQVTPFSLDRKSTRLNSSHVSISYAVFCLKKKNDLMNSTDLER